MIFPFLLILWLWLCMNSTNLVANNSFISSFLFCFISWVKQLIGNQLTSLFWEDLNPSLRPKIETYKSVQVALQKENIYKSVGIWDPAKGRSRRRLTTWKRRGLPFFVVYFQASLCTSCLDFTFQGSHVESEWLQVWGKPQRMVLGWAKRRFCNGPWKEWGTLHSNTCFRVGDSKRVRLVEWGGFTSHFPWLIWVGSTHKEFHWWMCRTTIMEEVGGPCVFKTL